MICSLLENWIIIVDVRHTNRERGLGDMSRVRGENAQLILLALLVVEVLLQDDFAAELVDGEDGGGDVGGVLEVGLVVLAGQETVGDGWIGVNIIRRHCRQNRAEFSS